MELNKETERLMVPVDAAISRHVKWLSDAWTDIHNRASSAIETAVIELATEKARNARFVEWMRGKCECCDHSNASGQGIPHVSKILP